MLDGVAERAAIIAERSIASHWPFIGSDYRHLMIVGQALAGWDDKSSPALWTPAAVRTESGRLDILRRTREWAAARTEPIEEPLTTRARKPFWSVSRRIVEALHPDGDGAWYSRYAWWNLFPLGWGDTNRSPWFDALWEAQEPYLHDLFWAVIEALNPRHVVVLAGKDFWGPTRTRLGLADLNPLEFPLIAGGTHKARVFVWTYHPGAQVRGHSRARLASAVVDAIRAIEAGGSTHGDRR